MSQNQSVRHRLKNQLNVQLTDSNIIEDHYNHFTSSIKRKIQNQQSCDISLIDDLQMLDKIDTQKYSLDSLNQNISNNTDYMKTDRIIPKLQMIDESLILYEKISSFSNIRNRINSLQEENQKNFTHHRNLPFDLTQTPKLMNIEVRTRRRANTFNNESIRNVRNTSNFNTKNQQSNYSNSGKSDIQQKISILPLEVQKRIKQNLQRRALQSDSFRNQSFREYKFERKDQNNNIRNYFSSRDENNESIEFIANPAVSFILPVNENLQNRLNNRQKFVSVNRQTSIHNHSKSNKKNIILKQSFFEIQSQHINKNLIMHQQNVHRSNEHSLSKQKNLYNTINHVGKSPSVLKVNQSKEKNTPFIINTKNQTQQLIQKRRNQFAQYYKQQQQKNTQSLSIYENQHLKAQNLNQKNKQQIKNCQNNSQNQDTFRQNIIQLSEKFNKSKIIKHYTQILSSISKCRKCSMSYGAFTLTNQNTVTFTCNQCDLKNNLQRSVSFLNSNSSQSSQNKYLSIEKTSSRFNHPIIGVLFDLENKLQNQQEMKNYNLLLKEISKEIQKIDQLRKKLNILLTQIEELKGKVIKNPKVIFEAKTQLKKYLSLYDQHKQKVSVNSQFNSISSILPCEYLTQLDIWCKINAKKFTEYPIIDSKLQQLCPLYMKRYIKTMSEFLNPLFHNFETSNVRISVSEGLKLPVRSLEKATFVIDGPYNISQFQKINKLSLQFLNKRTFREIASVMQCLPQNVDEIQMSYNHKLNSHISAQKYPILTKLVSLRSCKNLNARILNCKDEDDLLSAFRVITKKKSLKLQTVRSIYVRKSAIQCTKQLKEMLKRLGKNICSINLKLSFLFNQPQIYTELMKTQRNKLIDFTLISTLVPSQIESPINIGNILSHSQINDNILSHSQESLIQTKDKQNQGIPKKSFLNKMRKKITAFVLLKQSFAEKESIQTNKNQPIKSVNEIELQKKYQANHLLRLQVLKILL